MRTSFEVAASDAENTAEIYEAQRIRDMDSILWTIMDCGKNDECGLGNNDECGVFTIP